MKDVLITLVCLYFGVTNVRQLAAVPLNQWAPVQWLLALVTVVLFALGLYKGWQVVRAMAGAQKLARDKTARIRAEQEAKAAEAAQAAPEADDENGAP